MWTAYAADPAVPVPDLPSATTLDENVAEFATQIRRSIEFSGGATEDYFTLAGRAVQIGRSVPAGVQEAIRSLATDPGRTTAPAVLLLTEELVVPRELASPTPEADHPVGRLVAVPCVPALRSRDGRWTSTSRAPTSADRRRPDGGGPDRRLHWRRRMEAPGEAVAEAAEVAVLFTPPARRAPSRSR